MLRAREINLTEGSRARRDQRWPDHTFVRVGFACLGPFTGITLRAEALYRGLLYESQCLLYESCAAGG